MDRDAQARSAAQPHDPRATHAGVWDRVRVRAHAPVSAASLTWFRVAFGLLMAGGVARFVQAGWVDTLYGPATRHVFHYPGFAWLTVPPLPVLYAVFGAQIACALLLAAGQWPRVSALLLAGLVLFTELLDVTNYLNHHMQLVWLAVLLAVLPTPGRGAHTKQVPAFAVWMLRAQVAAVYIFAAWAKVGTDWLVHGQPLGLWIASRTHLPVLGPLFAQPWCALLMSWAGFLYDASIVGLLLWHRTRLLAYGVVVAFHVVTAMLFDIGLFPPLMIVSTTLFFAPDWPHALKARLWPWARRTWRALRSGEVLLAAPGEPAPRVSAPASAPVWPQPAWRLTRAFCVVWSLVQWTVPLRSVLYGGDVNWHEQGMRFSWKVMVREKNGDVTYHVNARTEAGEARHWQITPHQYLTWRQANEMSSQPDLIVQLGQIIAADMRGRGLHDVRVTVEAWVSLNGRRPALLLDPRVDLTTLDAHQDLRPWIMPRPTDLPLHGAMRRLAAH